MNNDYKAPTQMQRLSDLITVFFAPIIKFVRTKK